MWLVALLFASQVLHLPAGTTGTLGHDLVSAFAAKTMFYYLAWLSVAWLLFDSEDTRPASLSDLTVAAAVGLANMLPSSSLTWLSTTGVAIYLWATSHEDRNQQAAAAVLLAVAANGFWAPRVFDIFAHGLLRLDTALVGSILQATQPGISWHDTIMSAPGGHSILVFGPCSSFHNISLGLLCWIALTKLARTAWVAGDAVVAGLVALVVIGLNTARLYLMALGAEDFQYWHAGFGAEIFAWATTGAVLLISAAGIQLTGRTQ
ncbi:MAG TPA: hypothetical protein VG900_06495 [Hyphomicrobiaceae bacterium]|nr:hypothetical protein [Hyphomicrobiaceae bacterium]